MARPSKAEQVAPGAGREARTLVALAVTVIVIGGLYVAQDVLIPITLAVILSFMLSPLVNLLGRIGLWRTPAVIASVLVALGVIGLVGALIGSQAAALATDAPRYAETLGEKVQGAEDFATSRISALTSLFPRLGRMETPPQGASAAPRSAGRTRTQPTTPTVVAVEKSETSPLVLVRTILAPVLGPLETTVIVIVVAIFILIQKEDLRDRFIRLVGSTDLNRTTVAIDEATQRLSRYFVSQLAVNTTFGLVVGLGLWAIGVPSPAMWGVLSGLLRFVPYVGPFLAAVPPIALAAAIDPGWTKALYVGLLYLVVEPLTGYVVEPLLYGHSTGLSPISVIVAAVFWTWLWGPIGLILSTPLTLCLVVVGRHAKPLEFFDVLLGDRPALPAVDRFHHRILANDPDDVLAQAEGFVDAHSLVEYYDAIALPGLALAARDVARGAMGAARAADVARSMTAITSELGGLAGNEDGAPRTVTHAITAVPGVVACVPGPGCFDGVVSAMLAQVLERRGISTRVLAHESVSRDTISRLDLEGVSVLALSNLELSGLPAHLRYLVNRLRTHAPDAAIVVGLWRPGDGVLSNRETAAPLGADRAVSSLAEAAEAILTLGGGR